MCTCASCEYTDGLGGFIFEDGKVIGSSLSGGFKNWPRGDPAGKRSSEKAYAAHVAHAWSGSYKRIPFKPGQPPQFDTSGLVMPVTPAPKYVLDWINRKTPEAAEAAPASPAQPGKAAQHLPDANRDGEPRAILYVMAKGKSPYITVPQAADSLGCSESRILQWIHEERIPGAIKPARDWLIPSNAKRPEELPRGRPKQSKAG